MLEWLIGFIWLSEFGVVHCEVHGGYPPIVAIEVADYLERRDCQVSCEHVLEGGYVGIFKHCQYLIVECGIHILELIVFTTVFLAFREEFFLLNGAVHARIVDIQPGSVRRTKRTVMTSAYFVSVSTRPRWLLWTPPHGLLINTSFLVRRLWVYWIYAQYSLPRCLGRDKDGKP